MVVRLEGLQVRGIDASDAGDLFERDTTRFSELSQMSATRRALEIAALEEEVAELRERIERRERSFFPPAPVRPALRLVPTDPSLGRKPC